VVLPHLQFAGVPDQPPCPVHGFPAAGDGHFVTRHGWIQRPLRVVGILEDTWAVSHQHKCKRCEAECRKRAEALLAVLDVKKLPQDMTVLKAAKKAARSASAAAQRVAQGWLLAGTSVGELQDLADACVAAPPHFFHTHSAKVFAQYQARYPLVAAAYPLFPAVKRNHFGISRSLYVHALSVMKGRENPHRLESMVTAAKREATWTWYLGFLDHQRHWRRREIDRIVRNGGASSDEAAEAMLPLPTVLSDAQLLDRAKCPSDSYFRALFQARYEMDKHFMNCWRTQNVPTDRLAFDVCHKPLKAQTLGCASKVCPYRHTAFNYIGQPALAINAQTSNCDDPAVLLGCQCLGFVADSDGRNPVQEMRIDNPNKDTTGTCACFPDLLVDDSKFDAFECLVAKTLALLLTAPTSPVRRNPLVSVFSRCRGSQARRCA
jgi:uncharacterized CHY-type Zn-finger protein